MGDKTHFFLNIRYKYVIIKLENGMKDFIFIIGPSAVGKSTLAKGLFEHYKGEIGRAHV